MSKLLNYKNKISIVKQNELFQKCLSQDKIDTIQKKYEIAKNVKREEEKRLAELRRQSRTQPKVVMIAESSDSDSNKSFDPKKVKAVQNKKSKTDVTSMDIMTKNGYLFKQIKQNDPSKKTKKLVHSKQYYCRHKYFQNLP